MKEAWEMQEKKRLKNAYLTANLAAVPVLMQDGMARLAYMFSGAYSSAFYTVFSALIIRLVPYGAYYRWMNALDAYCELIMEIAAYPFFVLLPFAVFAAARGISFREATGKKKAPVGLCLASAGCALGLSVPAQYLAMAIDAILGKFGLYEGAYGSVVAFDGISLILTLLSVCILPPLFEEYAYRGVLFSEISRQGGTGTAILITALFFGVMHQSLMSLPNALLFGLFAGWLRSRYDTLLPCITGHAAVNLSAIGYEIAAARLPGELYGQMALAADGICLALGAFGAAYFVYTRRNSEEEKPGGFYNGETADRQALGRYVSAVSTVVLIVWCIWRMSERLWLL